MGKSTISMAMASIAFCMFTRRGSLRTPSHGEADVWWDQREVNHLWISLKKWQWPGELCHFQTHPNIMSSWVYIIYMYIYIYIKLYIHYIYIYVYIHTKYIIYIRNIYIYNIPWNIPVSLVISCWRSPIFSLGLFTGTWSQLIPSSPLNIGKWNDQRPVATTKETACGMLRLADVRQNLLSASLLVLSREWGNDPQ